MEFFIFYFLARKHQVWSFISTKNDSDLCVVTTVAKYIKDSSHWKTEGQNELLLGFIWPHFEV